MLIHMIPIIPNCPILVASLMLHANNDGHWCLACRYQGGFGLSSGAKRKAGAAREQQSGDGLGPLMRERKNTRQV